VARELIRTAVAKTYDDYFSGVDLRQVVQWFDLGGEIQVSADAAAHEVIDRLNGIQGLVEKISALGVSSKNPVEAQVSAAEFILEGLYAHKRIGRSEERVFTAGDKQTKKPERTYEREDPPFRSRRSFN
jgi:magnesium chelatase subunit I